MFPRSADATASTTARIDSLGIGGFRPRGALPPTTDRSVSSSCRKERRVARGNPVRAAHVFTYCSFDTRSFGTVSNQPDTHSSIR